MSRDGLPPGSSFEPWSLGVSGWKLDPDLLQELAEGGGICEVCGGVHLADIESAIHLASAEDKAGIEVPVCTCEGCEICRDLKEAVARLIREDDQ